MAEIILSDGLITLVDDLDLPLLQEYTWHSMTGSSISTHYAVRHIKKERKSIAILMHREILGLQKGGFCDHINGNGLDNRRENLRQATHSQNMRNSRKNKQETSSKYKGVYREKRDKRWRANITVDGKKIKLGSFHIEKDAAIAYDKAAKYYFEEFANFNFEVI